MKSFLLGESDDYRDSIVSYIATARMAQSDDWLLEAVDPVYGSSVGRFYRCNGSMTKEDYTLITDFSSPWKFVRREIDYLKHSKETLFLI